MTSYQAGIDLGTTWTAAAAHRDGQTAIVPLGSRSAVVPSVVLLRADGETLTGEAAERRALSEPERVVREFKRRFGDTTPIIVGGSPYSAESLAARLLRAVATALATAANGPPSRVVVTHPANWGSYKRELLDQMVRLAGIDPSIVGFLTEPEAAALSYAARERVELGEVVAVYDLGGGTFDAAVLRRTATGFAIVGRPEGIERLGGIDFDAAVFAHVTANLGDAMAALDPADPATLMAVTRLRLDCVAAKEALSSDTDASIAVVLPTIQTEVRITRSEVEQLIRPALGDSIEALRRALRSASLAPQDVSRVLLVGGSSRIPLVAQMVSSELDRPVAVDAHPKHAVALGAAVAAAGVLAAPGLAAPLPMYQEPPTPPAAAAPANPALVVPSATPARAAPAPPLMNPAAAAVAPAPPPMNPAAAAAALPPTFDPNRTMAASTPLPNPPRARPAAMAGLIPPGGPAPRGPSAAPPGSPAPAPPGSPAAPLSSPGPIGGPPSSPGPVAAPPPSSVPTSPRPAPPPLYLPPTGPSAPPGPPPRPVPGAQAPADPGSGRTVLMPPNGPGADRTSLMQSGPDFSSQPTSVMRPGPDLGAERTAIYQPRADQPGADQPGADQPGADQARPGSAAPARYRAAAPYPAGPANPAGSPYPAGPANPAGSPYPAGPANPAGSPYPAGPANPAGSPYPAGPANPAGSPYPAGGAYPGPRSSAGAPSRPPEPGRPSAARPTGRGLIGQALLLLVVVVVVAGAIVGAFIALGR